MSGCAEVTWGQFPFSPLTASRQAIFRDLPCLGRVQELARGGLAAPVPRCLVAEGALVHPWTWVGFQSQLDGGSGEQGGCSGTQAIPLVPECRAGQGC